MYNSTITVFVYLNERKPETILMQKHNLPSVNTIKVGLSITGCQVIRYGRWYQTINLIPPIFRTNIRQTRGWPEIAILLLKRCRCRCLIVSSKKFIIPVTFLPTKFLCLARKIIFDFMKTFEKKGSNGP